MVQFYVLVLDLKEKKTFFFFKTIYTCIIHFSNEIVSAVRTKRMLLLIDTKCLNHTMIDDKL